MHEHCTTPESPDPYRLAQLAVMRGGLVNRAVLQSLSLSDLMALAHAMAEHRPTRFTPDTAWAWLRMVIEPLEWEIKEEQWGTGRTYVAYFGGNAIASPPVEPGAHAELSQTMNAFFNETYPRTLVDPRWNIPHIPLLEACHAN